MIIKERKFHHDVKTEIRLLRKRTKRGDEIELQRPNSKELCQVAVEITKYFLKITKHIN